MKRILPGLFMTLLLIGASALSVLGQFRVVGYQPYWAGSASSIQYSKLTHINYSFALPQSDGRLKPLSNPAFLQQIVSNAHAVGTKVFIAIGGWSDNGVILDPVFESLASTQQGRNNLVNDALNLVQTYNLDGVDMDWEFPEAGASANNYAALMQQLSTELHNRGKQLSAAVNATSYYGSGILASVFGYVDFLNIMAYDNTDEANHSSYNFAQSTLNYWINTRGCPSNKVVLGVPFYARPSWRAYKDLLAAGANPNSDVFGSDYYNGIPTIQAKTELAWNRCGGIMAWELSQDATGANSLLSAIHTKKLSLGGGNNQKPTVSISSPSNGASFSAPASITISANAADADGSITRVEFYNGATLISSDNTSPYSITWSNVSAGNYSLTAKAYDNANAVTTSSAVAISVTTTTNQPPTVSITSPSNGASFTAPASFTIAATAADANGTVSKVEFFNGSTKLGEDLTSPYTLAWNNIAAGSYTITARATDNNGATTTSAAVAVSITSGNNTCSTPAWNPATAYNGGAEVSFNGRLYRAKWWTSGDQPDLNTGDGRPWADIGPCGNSNVAPSVSITAPSNGASFTAPASVNITANASDSDGSVAKVEFFNGATKLGEDLTSPYSLAWNNVAAGSYSITARATDNAGAVTTSSAVSISVTTSTNQAPTVSITSPANGTSFTAPASVTISANASDDGGVARVEFYNGSTLLGSDNSSPYSFTWSTIAAGSYSITARAFDNAGASTTSVAVSITVTSSNTGGCTGVASYIENGGYVAGSKVQNQGSLYECKPFPYSGWCNGAAWAYAPGTGAYWQDAWTSKGSCSSAKTAIVYNETEAIYPNPASNTTTVVLTIYSEVESSESLTILSSSGEVVKTESVQLQNGENKLTLQVSGLNEGLYLIRAGQKTFKFIKK